ncbi:hypothetical protein [Natronorubrum sp. DTA28]|uniref:hypothetical protein n=1 Tax=Natronorubrum sp. DTA28 TaxID=3447019 RepID=UPI003F84380F
MKRVYVFVTLAAVLAAMGMGVGLAAADEPGDDTHSILDRTDAENASESQVETVQNWATDEQLEALNDSEHERVETWLEDAPELESAEPDEYEVAFGDGGTWITEYELEDGEARITFVADQERTVDVEDAMDGIGQDGIVEPYSREYNLSGGETTISMDVREFRGASTVGVTVDGSTARLSTEMEEPSDADDNPFETFGGESGLFFGVFMSVGLAGLGTVIVLRQEESGVIEA